MHSACGTSQWPTPQRFSPLIPSAADTSQSEVPEESKDLCRPCRAKKCRGILTVHPNLHGCWPDRMRHTAQRKSRFHSSAITRTRMPITMPIALALLVFSVILSFGLRHTDTQAQVGPSPGGRGCPPSSLSCDSQDLTLQAILSNGVATVRQILSRVFSAMAAQRAKKRVESRTGAVALVFRWLVSRLSPALPQSGLAWLCFLFPLIEPNRRVSRIRLSEKVSRGRPRKADRSHTKLDEPKLLMQGGFRIPFGRRPSQLVLGTQPLAQPSTSMSF
jgi:hypothetical protein